MARKSIKPKIIAGGYNKIIDMIKKEANYAMKLRLNAILRSLKGATNSEIARHLCCDPRSVSSWIKKWNKGGYLGLKDKHRSGRPRLFTSFEEDIFMKTIKHDLKVGKLSDRYYINCMSMLRIIKNCRRVTVSFYRREIEVAKFKNISREKMRLLFIKHGLTWTERLLYKKRRLVKRKVWDIL